MSALRTTFGVPGAKRQFARHYLEMVAAMGIGMVALGIPAGGLLSALGVTSAELSNDAPAVLLLGMAAAMTAPMVAWMRYRGHGWQPSSEMAASMFVPTFAVLVPLAAGTTDDTHALLMIQHVAMLAAMLAVMLLRPAEYAHAHAAHHAEATA